MKQYEARIGMDIYTECKALQELADKYGTAYMNFNDICINAAEYQTTADSLVRFFHEESDRRMKEYEQSPKGIAKRQVQETRNNYRDTYRNALMFGLENAPQVIFKDQLLALNWLCEIEDGRDLNGKLIVKIFNQNGYFENVNTEENFDENSIDNYARYIIGQALNFLSESNTIHQMVLHFRDKLKERIKSGETK